MTNDIQIVGVQPMNFEKDGTQGTMIHCLVADPYIKDGCGVIRFFIFSNRIDGFPPLEVGNKYSATYHRSKASRTYVLDTLL